MTNNRIVIAGSRSGVGKTTVSLGLMAALTQRKFDIQPYKVGPDYIDPGFHTLVTGNFSYNLDSYFLGKNGVKELYKNSVNGSDLAIIEGVMGLFDGKGKKGFSSTAEIAKILKSPVILVVDGKKMAQSGAALAYGYKNYDEALNVKGVVLNNIVSERHYQLLKEAIEDRPVDLKVLGYIPCLNELELPERHLGLVPTRESKNLDDYFSRLVGIMEEYTDLNEIFNIASNLPEIKLNSEKLYNQQKKYDIKLGIAYDQAFNFYYKYNLDLLKGLGADLIYFSPVKDKKLPEVDAVYIGGGFPESFLECLAANQSLKDDIKEKVNSGMPIYAECGGLMYLSKEIIDLDGNRYPMLDLISASTIMKKSLQEMGYREIKSVKDNIILKKGEKARGHVFHYSRLDNWQGEIECCYQLKNFREGYQSASNIMASYVHLHFASNINIAHNLLQNAQHFTTK
ncbi:MAG: cobyrinate a,c-diamide synthase [Bacillota bacterium]